MKYNPTELEYDTIEPGNAPRYGVTTSTSYDFHVASRDVLAWFVNVRDAHAYRRLSNTMTVWDLEQGKVSLGMG